MLFFLKLKKILILFSSWPVLVRCNHGSRARGSGAFKEIIFFGFRRSPILLAFRGEQEPKIFILFSICWYHKENYKLFLFWIKKNTYNIYALLFYAVNFIFFFGSGGGLKLKFIYRIISIPVKKGKKSQHCALN